MKMAAALTQDGILIVDKPAGWTSHDVVARARKLLKTRRIGHTGTLDPFATGVLILCINQATRLVRYLTGDEKEYHATVRLGVSTDTGDLTGEPLSQPADARSVSNADIERALAGFRGKIKQIPPMFSAKKIGGKKLYEMARSGQVVERQPIEIEIKKLELEPEINAPAAEPQNLYRDFNLRVVCSSGTYIRTLAEDIGNSLGMGAHLIQLRRLRVGACNIDHALNLDRLGKLATEGKIADSLISPARALTMPELTLDEQESREIIHGRPLKRPGGWISGTLAKFLTPDHQLAAIAEYDAEAALWRPKTVLSS